MSTKRVAMAIDKKDANEIITKTFKYLHSLIEAMSELDADESIALCLFVTKKMHDIAAKVAEESHGIILEGSK